MRLLCSGFTEHFAENASRPCLPGGDWDSLTDYTACLSPREEDVASDISLYIYLVGGQAELGEIL